MNIMTKDQRARALELIAKAPDEILLDAVVELRKHWHIKQAARANFDLVADELRGAEEPPEQRVHFPSRREIDAQIAASAKEIAERSKAKREGLPTEPAQAAEGAEERPNVSPGIPSTGKIGSNTKAEILDLLQRGESIKVKHIEACKLLWARREVKYDGRKFYL